MHQPLRFIIKTDCWLIQSRAAATAPWARAISTQAKPKATSTWGLGRCTLIFMDGREDQVNQIIEPESWIRVSWVHRTLIAMISSLQAKRICCPCVFQFSKVASCKTHRIHWPINVYVHVLPVGKLGCEPRLQNLPEIYSNRWERKSEAHQSQWMTAPATTYTAGIGVEDFSVTALDGAVNCLFNFISLH